MTALQETNRTQRLILGFFALTLVLLVSILLFDPEIYNSTLSLVPVPHVNVCVCVVSVQCVLQTRPYNRPYV